VADVDPRSAAYVPGSTHHALAVRVEALEDAAREVELRWRETAVYYGPLDAAIKKLIHALSANEAAS
jgi:hypothetical protein